jgi:hypothetical protein
MKLKSNRDHHQVLLLKWHIIYFFNLKALKFLSQVHIGTPTIKISTQNFTFWPSIRDVKTTKGYVDTFKTCVCMRDLGACGLASGGQEGVRVDLWEVGGLKFDFGWKALW